MDYSDVKSLRETAGLTQKAMSAMFKIPLRTVSDWERGLRKPPEWVCMLLYNALVNYKNES